MSFWPVFGLMLTTFGLSLLLTGLLRRHALHTQLMDVPNQRSSHSRPTPQGGGLAVVISFPAGLGITWPRAQPPTSWPSATPPRAASPPPTAPPPAPPPP